MDKSQYQPPRTAYSAELYKQMEQSAIQHTPERLKQGPFQSIKNIEAFIISCRDTAEAIEQRNGRVVELKFLPISFVRPARKHHEIHKELIEAERRIGGDVFAEKGKYHFWFGGGSHSSAQTQGVGHWYIEEIASGAITHLETSADSIAILNHSGQPVPVTLSDLEIFIPAACHYVYAVMDKYPFDKDRAEVLLENMDFPDLNDIATLLPPAHNDGSQKDFGLAA